MGHVLMENRHGLVVGGRASLATGAAEREEALALIEGLSGIPCGSGMMGEKESSLCPDARSR
jgi:hypothetical protein